MELRRTGGERRERLGVQKTAAARSRCDLGHGGQARTGSPDPTDTRKTPLRQKPGADSEKVTSGNTDSKEKRVLDLSDKLPVKQIIGFWFCFFPEKLSSHY